jgi:hypothetical protein
MQEHVASFARPLLPFDLVAVFLLATVGTVACLICTGASLGLFFGGIVLAAVLAPPVALLNEAWPRRLILVGGMVDGVGVVWLVLVFQGSIALGQWLLAYALLIAFTSAAVGLGCLLRSARTPALLASTLATLTSICWLASPIWLMPGIESPRLLGALIDAHPLLAINGILRHLGIWTEHALMYRLTNLGQDVPYQLPSPLPAIAFHGFIGLMTLAAAAWLDRRRRHRPGVSLSDPHTRSTRPPAR